MTGKDIILLLLGIMGGGLASWIITFAYYRKSLTDQKQANAEQARILNKLPDEFKKKLDEDVRDRLSVIELNELLDRRVRDPKGPMGYKACPTCGSEDLDYRSQVDPQRDDLYEFVTCKKCGWGDWMG